MRLGEYAGGSTVYLENMLAAQDPALANAVKAEQKPWEDYLTAGLRVLNSYVMADSQRQLLKVQLQRAQQGLPPLDSGQYGLGVNVGLSPETLRTVALVGLGALVLFAFARKR